MATNGGRGSLEEIKIDAGLTEHGVKASVRSRAAVAFDRLIGNLFDLGNAALEGRIRKTDARTEGQLQMVKMESEAAARKLETLSSLGDPLIDDFLKDRKRKVENREAVSRYAYDQLLLTHDTAESGHNDENRPINEDWLNLFSSHAENATSDRLRAMWGQVLAGEIREPGSFSLTTLRFISELDQDMAVSFEKAIKTRLSSGFIPKPKSMSGDVLLEYTFLEEIGLLSGVNAFIGMDIGKNVDGYFYFFDDKPKLNEIFLRIKADTNEIRLDAIRVTRIGREIASLLPKEDQSIALRAVSCSIADVVEECFLCHLTKMDSGGIFWTVIERLKG